MCTNTPFMTLVQMALYVNDERSKQGVEICMHSGMNGWA